MSDITLARRIAKIQPSATLALTANANLLAAKGHDVIALTAGEPDFWTPENIRRTAIDALENTQAACKYTPSAGSPALREAIAHKFKRDNGLEYTPAQTMASCGAKHSVFNALAALVDEGDEVILAAPYWVSYPEMVSFLGGKSVVVDTSSTGFVLTPEALRSVMTDKTRVVMLNTPGNPSGVIWTAEQQRALADILVGTNVAVISDEIYEKLIYGGEHISFASLSDDAYSRTVTVNGVAKAYAMTGWRIGFAGGPAHVVKAMNSLQSHSTSNPATVSQLATIKALSEDPKELPDWIESFRKRRDIVVEALNAIDGVTCSTPGGAFYVFPDFRALLGKSLNGRVLDGDLEFCDALLNDVFVAGVPGTCFGAPGFMRMSYAAAEESLREALKRIADFCGRLE
ncbi:pyridoxal phosphate-dependent aminotransferase [Planctomycetota bacterium]|nr:pyridoxal phosphate-dependent aminotransferase [Planctomycetota bacterium]